MMDSALARMNELRDRIGRLIRRLSTRERRILQLALVLIPVVLFVMKVWIPITDRIEAIRHELPKLQAQAREAQQLADRLQKGLVKGRTSGDMITIVEKAAVESGARSHIKRIHPKVGMDARERLEIVLENVPYPVLIRFLANIQDRGGEVMGAKLRAGSASGQVQAQVQVGG